MGKWVMEPFLKWAGGKRWQVPFLQRVWADHTAGVDRRLVEPFCGGLSVALGLQPAQALLNDANPHLINLYRRIAEGFSFDLEMDAESYYANRDWFNALIAEGQVEGEMQAQLFYYLNRVGFNGLCRFSREGKFNVPVGSAHAVPRLDVEAYRTVLARWTFTTGDFGALEMRPDDFLYADPPYDGGFTSYTAGQFSWDDQERVALMCASHPGPVILTNRATDQILSLYRKCNFNLITVPAPRRVGGDRAPVLEVIATNFFVDLDGIISVLEGAKDASSPLP